MFSARRGLIVSEGAYQADVVAFDEGGTPYVMDGPSLTRSYGELSHKEDDYVQLIPAPGWFAWWYLEEERGLFSQPLVAWGLDSQGLVYALTTDSDGVVSRPNEDVNFVAIQHERDGKPDVEEARQAIDRRRELSQLRVQAKTQGLTVRPSQ